MKLFLTLGLILSLFLMFSCQTKKDVSCRDAYDFYQTSLTTVKNFRTAQCNDSTVGNIYFANEYLKLMTGINYSYIIVEHIPTYNSLKDKEKDIRNWKNWFKRNKVDLNKEKSDSIMEIVWDKHIAW